MTITFRRSRDICLILCLTLGGFAANGWMTTPLAAQEPAAESAPAPAPAPAAAEESTAHPKQTMLSWVIKSSGLIGAFILVLSFYMVASVIRNFMELRRSELMPEEVLADCDKLIEARDFQGLYKRVSTDESYFSGVLAAGIAELRHGIGEAREAMERTADSLIAEMERKISMIAVLGTLGPMIGLLGTLKGMISSFSVIALSDVQMRPSEVAGGISEALILTFEGVGLAIPAIFFFALFRNRILAYSAEASTLADGYLRRVFDSVRSKGPAGDAPGAGA